MGNNGNLIDIKDLKNISSSLSFKVIIIPGRQPYHEYQKNRQKG